MSKKIKLGLTFGLALWSLFCILSVSNAQDKEWTFMVYLDGDNDLEDAAIDDFMEMSTIGSNDKINIVVQFDRCSGYDGSYGNWEICHRFLITKGMKPYQYNAITDWGDGKGGREVNMAATQTVTDFVNFGVSNYPAKKYAFVFWNHGGGWREKIKELQQRGRIDGIGCMLG